MDSKMTVLVLSKKDSHLFIDEIKLIREQGYRTDIIDPENIDSSTLKDFDLIIVTLEKDNYLQSFQQAEMLIEKQIPVLFLSNIPDIEVLKEAQKISTYGYVLADGTGINLLSAVRTAGRLLEKEDTEARSLESSLEELIGKYTEKHGEYSEQKAIQKQIIEETLRKGRWSGEVVSWDVDGNEILTYCRTQLVKDKQGNKIALAWISTDLSERKKAEKKIKESELNYRELYTNIPVGIYRTTPEGKISMANPALIEMLGYRSFDELADRNLASDYYETGYKREDFISMIEDKGFVQGLISEWTTRDGRKIVLSENARAIRDGKGKTLYYEGSVENITARNRAEEALNERNLFIEKVFNSLPGNVVYIFDLIKQCVVYSNSEISNISGYSSEEFQAMGDRVLNLLIHPDDLQAIKEHLSSLQTCHENEVRTIEYRIKHKDGTWIWLENHDNIFSVDESGKPLQAIGSARDITERKIAEVKLRESEEYNRSIINLLPDIIIKTNDKGEYLDIFSSSEDKLILPKADVLGKKIKDVIPEKQAVSIMKALKKCIVTQSLQLVEYEIPISGNNLFFEARIVPSGKTEALALILDITERKQAERVQKALEETIYGIIEMAPFSIQLLDPKGYTVRVNPAFIRLFGVAPPQGYTVLDDPNFARSDIYRETLKLLTKGEQVSFPDFFYNTRLISDQLPDNPLWIHAEGFPLLDDNGKVKNLVFMHEDITERKKAEEALRLSEKHSAFLAQTAFELIELNSLQEIYQYTVKKLYNLFEGNSIVTLVEYNHKKNRWKMKQIEGIGKIAGKLSGLLGFDIKEMEEDIPIKYYDNLTSGSLTEIDFDFPGLTNNRLSAAVGRLIKKMLSIDKMYCIAFGGEEHISGNITLITNKKIGQINTELIESFILQVSTFVNKLQAEENVKENENLLNLFFTQSMDGFFFMMLDEPIEWNDKIDKEKALDYFLNNQRFTKVNQALLDQYKAAESEFLKLTPYDIFKHKIDYGRIFFKELLDKGKWRGETHDLRMDGSEMIVHGNYICLYDNKKRIIGHFGIQTDVTEKKHAEEAIKLSEAKYRELFDSNLNGIIRTDLSGRIIEVNPSFLKMTGYKNIGEIKKNYQELTPQKWHSYEEDIVKNQILKRGYSDEYEKEYIHKSGKAFPVSIKVWLIKDNNKAVGMWGIAQDITERKKAEEERLNLQKQLAQSQKLEAIGNLAGGIAHDINTTLSIIIGLADFTLIQLEKEIPVKKQIKGIIEAANRSSSLIQQLLAFARKQPVEPQIVNVNDIIESLLTMIKQLLGYHIAIEWSPDKELLPVEIDPGQLDQIIMNLCVNARDAIEEEGGTVNISTKNIDDIESMGKYLSTKIEPGRYIRIKVADDGCGMNAETAEKMFDPFFTTKDNGTGLGLSTVLGIVKQNKGYLKADTGPGDGTVFYIYLPATEAQEPAKEDRYIKKSVPDAKKDTLILVVDDEEAVLNMIDLILKSCDYQTVLASNPLKALQLYAEKKNDISIVITDIMMPEMNGVELAKEMSKIRPDLKVVFISGYGKDFLKRYDISNILYRFVNKPFTTAMLKENIEDLLNRES